MRLSIKRKSNIIYIIIGGVSHLKMKRIAYIAVIFLMLLACGPRKEYGETLLKAEAMMNDHPDSALLILGQLKDTMRTAGKADRMYYELLLADAQNKTYVDFTTDSIMKEVAHYYDRHGSANERMRAHYLLGCSYRDMGEAPMALQCYQDAVECADTTSKECNYHLLCCVHSQMSDLFRRQYLPRHAIDEIWKAYHCAMHNQDTLTSLRCYEHLSNAYFQLHKPDSSLYYSLRSADLYKSVGDTASANSALAPAIYVYLQREEYDKAEILLKAVGEESNMFNPLNSKVSTFYNYMGLLSLGKNELVDANRYLYEALKRSRNNEDLEFSCQSLCRFYKTVGNADSIIKYTELYCELNDSSVARMSTSSVAQLQSLYNYSRNQRIVEKSEREKLKLDAQNKLLFVILGALLCLGVAVVLFLRNRKNKTIRENIQEIEQLKFTIDEMINKSAQDIDDNLNSFEESAVYLSLVQNARDMKKAGLSQLNELRKTANQLLPRFMYQLNHKEYELSCNEINLCILIKAGFRPSEIAILLNMTSQNISNLRNRLNKKLFNTNKGARNFDEKITNLR